MNEDDNLYIFVAGWLCKILHRMSPVTKSAGATVCGATDVPDFKTSQKLGRSNPGWIQVFIWGRGGGA